MSSSQKKISVLGSGTMGNGIAHVFAQFGHSVTLIDISEDALKRALTTIDKNLGRQVEKGTIDSATHNRALSAITTTTSLQNGVSAADLVVEAATENLSTKLKLFTDLDAATPPGAILATNTSSISITQIAAATQNPAR